MSSRLSPTTTWTSYPDDYEVWVVCGIGNLSVVSDWKFIEPLPKTSVGMVPVASVRFDESPPQVCGRLVLGYHPATRNKVVGEKVRRERRWTSKVPLDLNSKPALGFTSAANPVLLPKTKPWAMREHFVVPSIGSRDVAPAERSRVRRCEDALKRSISAMVPSWSFVTERHAVSAYPPIMPTGLTRYE
jgi:hypothetical protein